MKADIRWCQLVFRLEFWWKFQTEFFQNILMASAWNLLQNSGRKTSWHHLISVFIYLHRNVLGNHLEIPEKLGIKVEKHISMKNYIPYVNRFADLPTILEAYQYLMCFSTLISSFSGISKCLPSTFLCIRWKQISDDVSWFSGWNSGGNSKQNSSRIFRFLNHFIL